MWTYLQYVTSRTLQVTSGVPQGSILGPLLFIISIDPTFKLQIPSSLSMYADGIALYRLVTDNLDVSIFQSDITFVSEWVETRGLRHLTRTRQKCTSFSRKRSGTPSLDLKLGKTKLAQVNTYKCLGLWLSSDLFWSTHVEYTCLRVRKQLGLILRCFRDFNGNCLAHLY